MMRCLVCAIGVLSLAACGVGAAPEVDTSELTYNTCSPTEKVGKFRVDLREDFTGVTGSVQDGVVPGRVPEVLQTAGECSLLSSKNPFCGEPCGAGRTCGDSGTCIDEPKNRDVGTVTIDGMLDDVTIQPAANILLYSNPGSLSHPGFPQGAAISLATTGGDYEPFTLRGWGVAPLVMSEVDSIVVTRDQPLAITWQAPTMQGPTAIDLLVRINNHGGTPAWIECEVSDTGSYSIPASLISALIDSGFSGFPDIVVSRSSSDSLSIEPGCVQFRVISERQYGIQLDGLTSCNVAGDCPAGQSCNEQLFCE